MFWPKLLRSIASHTKPLSGTSVGKVSSATMDLPGWIRKTRKLFIETPMSTVFVIIPTGRLRKHGAHGNGQATDLFEAYQYRLSTIASPNSSQHRQQIGRAQRLNSSH